MENEKLISSTTGVRPYLMAFTFVAVAALAGLAIFEYKTAVEYSRLSDAEHRALIIKLDSLERKVQLVKKDLQAKYLDTIKISFNESQQQPEKVRSVIKRIYELREHDVSTAEGESLYHVIDDASTKAVKDAITGTTESGTGNAVINNLSFGAGERDLLNKNIINNNGKISLNLAKANGLAVAGRVTPVGSNRARRTTLDFVLTYIDEETGVRVTPPFSEDLVIPEREGIFYHRIWLENDQYKPGIYRITVYLRGTIISRQNVEITKD